MMRIGVGHVGVAARRDGSDEATDHDEFTGNSSRKGYMVMLET